MGMSREEIKDELCRMLSDVVNGGYPIRNNTQRGRYREAVKEIIKTLEQEELILDKIRADINNLTVFYTTKDKGINLISQRAVNRIFDKYKKGII